MSDDKKYAVYLAVTEIGREGEDDALKISVNDVAMCSPELDCKEDAIAFAHRMGVFVLDNRKELNSLKIAYKCMISRGSSLGPEGVMMSTTRSSPTSVLYSQDMWTEGTEGPLLCFKNLECAMNFTKENFTISGRNTSTEFVEIWQCHVENVVSVSFVCPPMAGVSYKAAFWQDAQVLKDKLSFRQNNAKVCIFMINDLYDTYLAPKGTIGAWRVKPIRMEKRFPLAL